MQVLAAHPVPFRNFIIISGRVEFNSSVPSAQMRATFLLKVPTRFTGLGKIIA